MWLMEIEQPRLSKRAHCPSSFKKEKSELAGTIPSSATAMDLEWVRRDVVGYGATVTTPFGEKWMCYADYTASGRAMKSIEAFMAEKVLPTYANTHTTSSHCGAETTRLRDEAREAVAVATNAHATDDAVIFVGAGVTGAVNKMVSILGLDKPDFSKHRPGLVGGHSRSSGGGFLSTIMARSAAKAVVFVGPYEHHSNILPWREAPGCKVVQVPENEEGGIDRRALAKLLVKHRNAPLLIGSFSAGSNVTGVLTDVDAITKLLHDAGALAFWDYAAVAPHAEIDMNPGLGKEYSKDAVYISTHKLVGGPGATGLLVVKRRLLDMATVPSQPGGGTVAFVTENFHVYLPAGEEREEAGTPDILGSIRAGLALGLKHRLGAKLIAAGEEEVLTSLMRGLQKTHNVVLLGPSIDTHKRLAIASFLVRTPWSRDLYLHHNFVAAVLNDVFGIQVRDGCMCAGPYGFRLLGISGSRGVEFAKVLSSAHTHDIVKPGFVRVSLPFFAAQFEIDYVLRAIRMVAEDGYLLLPEYVHCEKSGRWVHKSRVEPVTHAQARRPSLLDSYEDSRRSASSNESLASLVTVLSATAPTDEYMREQLQKQLQGAKDMLESLKLKPKQAEAADSTKLSADFPTRLRWFALPDDAEAYRMHGAAPATTGTAAEGAAMLRPRQYSKDSIETVEAVHGAHPFGGRKGKTTAKHGSPAGTCVNCLDKVSVVTEKPRTEAWSARVLSRMLSGGLNVGVS